jgi:hypothetical protein
MDLIPASSPPIPGTPALIPGAPASVPHSGDIGTAPSSVHLRGLDGRFVNKGFGFEWHNLTQLINQPEAFGAELLEMAKQHMTDLATKIEDYAKANAPWTDRTGDARAGLHAIMRSSREVFEIDLGHSVYYGFFLENYNGGQYAIIEPTLRQFAPEMADIAAAHARGDVSPLPGGFE